MYENNKREESDIDWPDFDKHLKYSQSQYEEDIKKYSYKIGNTWHVYESPIKAFLDPNLDFD